MNWLNLRTEIMHAPNYIGSDFSPLTASEKTCTGPMNTP